VQPACKPGSVGHRCPDGHFSRSPITRTLQQPTRGVGIETGRLSPLIWPCSNRGLPCRVCRQTRGGLLPHRFTLTCGYPPAVWFLWHCPSLAAHATSAQALPGDLPSGARTFLDALACVATVRPAAFPSIKLNPSGRWSETAPPVAPSRSAAMTR